MNSNKKFIFSLSISVLAIMAGLFLLYSRQVHQKEDQISPRQKPGQIQKTQPRDAVPIYKGTRKIVEIPNYAYAEYYGGVYYWLGSRTIQNEDNTIPRVIYATELYSFDPRSGRVKQLSQYNHQRFMKSLGIDPLELVKRFERGKGFGVKGFDVFVTSGLYMKRIGNYIFYGIEGIEISPLRPVYADFIYDLRNGTISDSAVKTLNYRNLAFLRLPDRIVYVDLVSEPELTEEGGGYLDEVTDLDCVISLEFKSIHDDYPPTRDIATIGGLNCLSRLAVLGIKSDHEIYFSIASSTVNAYQNGLWSLDVDSRRFHYEGESLIQRKEGDFEQMDREIKRIDQILREHPLSPEYEIR